LKEIAGDRLHTMIRYAENDSECFPGYLLRYFGEEKPKPCGKCNNCLRYPDFEIREKIIKLIQVEKRITVDRLLESTGITNALQLKSVLMKMEADGLISHEPGYIIYHGKNYTPKS
jgi:superfamily II DNA helicase RecQ